MTTDCACQTGGAYRPPCSIPGGCGSVRGSANLCARAHQCRNRQTVETAPGETMYVGATCNRVLCDPCEQDLVAALRDLPDRYVTLANMLPRGAAGADAKTTGTKNPPLPLDVRVAALMSRTALVLTTWETEVRAVADDGEPATRVRQGTAVFTAASYLQRRTGVLMNLPPTTVHRVDDDTHMWATGGDYFAPIDVDGAGAIAEIFGLTASATYLIGLNKKVEQLDEACWSCRVKALTQTAGENGIVCSSCGERITRDEHDALKFRYAHMLHGRPA